MIADSFVSIVGAAAPSREVLVVEGLDDEEIEDVLAAFVCVPIVPSPTRQDSPLIDLVTRFDCSRVSVRGFMFVGPGEVRRGLIGRLEADPVRVEGEAVVFEDHADSQAQSVIARDQGAFLDALARVIRAPLRERNETLQRECSIAAGVEVDCVFWRVLTR